MGIGSAGQWIALAIGFLALSAAALLSSRRPHRDLADPRLRRLLIVRALLLVAGSLLAGAGVADEPWLSPLTLIGFAMLVLSLAVGGYVEKRVPQA